MQELLKEIKSVPSVMGSYVHITGVREVNSDLPKIFLGKLKEIGEIFDRVIKVNLATNMQTSTIEFKYDEAIIFLRPIDQDSCLITFCDGNVNKKMLNMTTGMLTNELKQTVAKARKEAASKPLHPLPSSPPPDAHTIAAPPVPTAATVKSIDVNKIIHAGPMARIFQDFQDALAMAIGPISEMVIKDAIEIWARAGECSQERLPELVELLIREIDDVSLEAEFKLAIKNHLR
ncbi:MAG: hypothetical protein HGA96_03305 [Desulfobulbaceae bacterium]|nr:hypothetical protein [Desulfobulbaceae bacterium]